MSRSRFTDFVPKWLRADVPVDALADSPDIGFEPPSAPKLPARIVPRDNGHDIGGLTLSDAVSTTQRILNYSSYEVVYGVHLDFADLRSIESDVLKLAKLRIEPFEEGSFVIPARLPEDSIIIPVDGVDKEFSPTQVLARFVALMEGVAQEGARFQTCIGALQAIEDLGKIINREAQSIEFYPVGFPGNLRRPRAIRVNDSYIESVSAAKRFRQDPRQQADDVMGTVTAVDIVQGKFKLRVERRQSVTGTYTPFMEDRMIQALGKKARLSGSAEYVSGRIRTIRAFEIELIDELEGQE